MKSGKRKPSGASGECHPKLGTIFLGLCAVAILLLVGLTIHYRGIQVAQPAKLPEDVSVEEYHRLIARAHDLLKRYKQLRGNASIPEDLGFKLPYSATVEAGDKSKASLRKERPSAQDDDKEEKEVVVQTYPLASSPRDAVMGMAMNTDPKNLVMLHLCG